MYTIDLRAISENKDEFNKAIEVLKAINFLKKLDVPIDNEIIDALIAEENDEQS